LSSRPNYCVHPPRRQAQSIPFNPTLNMPNRANVLPLLLCFWTFLFAPHPLDAQPPSLSISSTNNESIFLSWPAAATGYFLESIGELPGQWLRVTNPTTTASGEFRLVRPVTGKSQFFRLAAAQVLPPSEDFEISGYELANRVVLSVNLAEETYLAHLSNWSGTDAHISAALTGPPEGVSVIAANLTFGDVPAGATIPSTNAFTIRRDPTQPFNPAAFAWTIAANPLPPTTFALIDQSVAAGQITGETALLYKVYDDFADDRLPPQFRGRDDGFPDGSALLAAEQLWPTLSPATKQLLAPFRLLPTEPGSWVEVQAALQNPHPLNSASAAPLTSQSSILPRVQWSTIPAVSGKVRVSWMTTLRPDDAARAQAIAGEIDRYLWSKLTGLMGEPRPIPTADGTVRLDIYLTNIPRPVTKPFSLDAQGNSVCDGRPLPAMIILGPNDTNSDLAHEMMHAILHGYQLKNCFTTDYRWMHEATATWAEHFAYPDPNPEHGGNGRRGAYSYLQDPTYSLDQVDDDREYGAYLWFLFVTRGTSTGNPPYVRQIWDNAAGQDSLSAINSAIYDIGGFKRQFPEFALYNWNRMDDGGEPYRYYHTWDKLRHKARINGNRPIKMKLNGQTTAVETMTHLLPYLSADYFHFDFESDPTIRRIDFINPVYSTGAFPGAKVQAILKIRGQDWKPAEDWTALASKKFCRDRSSEDLEQLVIVISNSQHTQGSPLGTMGDPPEIQVSPMSCNPWEGTVRFTRTFRSDFTNIITGADSSISQIENNHEDLLYEGAISELIEEDGDIIEPGNTWQSWTFKLAGQFTASQRDSETLVSVIPDWTLTQTDVTQGSGNRAAEGELILRFDNDQFSFVTVAAGLGEVRYDVPLERTTATTVDCRSDDCPPSIPAETKPFGVWRLSFAESPGKNTDGAVITSTNNTLKVTLTRSRLEPFLPPFTGQEETTETITVDLTRSRAR
jgi:hypothetical protein